MSSVFKKIFSNKNRKTYKEFKGEKTKIKTEIGNMKEEEIDRHIRPDKIILEEDEK